MTRAFQKAAGALAAGAALLSLSAIFNPAAAGPVTLAWTPPANAVMESSTPPPEGKFVLCGYAMTRESYPGLKIPTLIAPEATEATINVGDSATAVWELIAGTYAKDKTCANTALADYQLSGPSNYVVTGPELQPYWQAGSADSNGNGLPDGWEMATFGELVSVSGKLYAMWQQSWPGSWGYDSDNDGIINLLDPDPDGDGVDTTTEFTDKNPETRPWRYDPAP